MADIDVVPKRRTNIWLWIVLPIIVALVMLALMGGFSNDAANRVGKILHHSFETPDALPSLPR